MEKLTLKELAPYLPYGLTVQSNRGGIYLMDIYSNMRGSGIEKREVASVLNEEMKPILRPLSDLAKEIEHDGEKFVPLDLICPKEDYSNEFEWIVSKGSIELQGVVKFSCTYFSIVQKLIEWKFDIFALLDKNLAVPVTESFNPYK